MKYHNITENERARIVLVYLFLVSVLVTSIRSFRAATEGNEGSQISV